MKKPRTERAQRRQQARALEKLTVKRQRLARHEPGGGPERPISVQSASEITANARNRSCPLCEGTHRVLDHRASTVQGRRLRIVEVECEGCSHRREIYYEVAERLLS